MIDESYFSNFKNIEVNPEKNIKFKLGLEFNYLNTDYQHIQSLQLKKKHLLKYIILMDFAQFFVLTMLLIDV